MSFDSMTEAAARRLARPYSRRTALGMFAGAVGALGLGSVGLASRASAAAGTFTLVNQTGQTIWPAISGTTVPNGGGLELAAGASATVGVPDNWSGRIWARTYCNFDGSGSGSCETGDCGGVLACNGASGAPNASLAEFTLGGGSAPDNYDVSLVDAFSLPMTITPQGGASCVTAGCTGDLLAGCPSELQDVDSSGNIVACLSSCSKLGGDQYCCTGSYLAPGACDPSSWQVNSASYFKSGCANTYSFANDTVTSDFACQGATGYTITFYPFGSGAGPSPAPSPASATVSPPASPQPTPTPTPTPTQSGGWSWGGGWGH
ncbi:MAG TPA: thaumatin family protein [Streptosporangiaceae bacterium]|nr:thaumatin family protein [Streptosporangiaceae bacterium]